MRHLDCGVLTGEFSFSKVAFAKGFAYPSPADAREEVHWCPTCHSRWMQKGNMLGGIAAELRRILRTTGGRLRMPA